MGYWASASLTYGFNVSEQSPDWFDDPELDDLAEFGSRMLLAADPETYVQFVREETTGDMLIVAEQHSHSCGRYAPEFVVIENMGPPADAPEKLEWAAGVLGFDVSGQEPVWRLISEFS